MINAGYTAKSIKEADDRIKAADKETAKLDEKIKALRSQGASDVDLREKEKKTEEQRKKNEKAAEDRRKKAEKAAEDAKRRAEEEAKIERDRLANLLKLEQDFRVQVQQVENEYFDSLLTAKEREENTVYDKYFVLIQQAKQYGMDSKALEAARTAELAKITKDYNDKELEAQKVIDDAKLESAKAYRLLFADEYEQELISFEDAQKEQADALNTALENKTITEEEYLKGQEKLEADYAAKIVEINDKKNKAVEDSNKKSFEDRMTEIQGYIEVAQMALDTLSAFNDLANQLGQNRIDEVNAQAEEQTAALDKQQQEELSNANLTAEEKTAIEEKFNQQKQAVLQKAFNEEERIKKAQFERDKAFKISQIAIDTAAAILKAISTYGPPPSPLGIFGIASASAIGIAQAATVAATKYKGGTPPAASTAGGASVSTGASASQFSAVNTNTQQTNLGDILGGGSAGTPTTSKVFVLESDITNTQQKVAVQQQLSTY
jgi:colicin import membrane protein